ncbi:hypothetical protein N7462_005006 [Penicillium macrosclerotiorum]|uniref:uncharacterized protein n=1 Tax=Penicillium macrosclerotiorum TaxID=303699 RepID=UPI002547BD7B|nr:uncharacterized protein N7462_005006 [Penicillium macrosclerotiorum]KAJ5690614.1 hypothetical protein N7462_005006 [Penicillium macrosclerotiorum]
MQGNLPLGFQKDLARRLAHQLQPLVTSHGKAKLFPWTKSWSATNYLKDGSPRLSHEALATLENQLRHISSHHQQNSTVKSTSGSVNHGPSPPLYMAQPGAANVPLAPNDLITFDEDCVKNPRYFVSFPPKSPASLKTIYTNNQPQTADCFWDFESRRYVCPCSFSTTNWHNFETHISGHPHQSALQEGSISSKRQKPQCVDKLPLQSPHALPLPFNSKMPSSHAIPSPSFPVMCSLTRFRCKFCLKTFFSYAALVGHLELGPTRCAKKQPSAVAAAITQITAGVRRAPGQVPLGPGDLPSPASVQAHAQAMVDQWKWRDMSQVAGAEEEEKELDWRARDPRRENASFW